MEEIDAIFTRLTGIEPVRIDPGRQILRRNLDPPGARWRGHSVEIFVVFGTPHADKGGAARLGVERRVVGPEPVENLARHRKKIVVRGTEQISRPSASRY